ncbi:MAG: hypothetical protein NTW22_00270 [Proteobacteria bacterium]|nr:hypothetical protein [Pseudomonadota bacterium]
MDSYSEKLSEAGMKTALEQAGKAKVNGSLYEISASSGFFDNHYQKRLKKTLGIPTIADLMLSSTNLDFELIAHNTIDLSSLVIPVIDAANSVTAGTEA